ncbi:hypothetical protein OL229_12755 [Neisseriaceae bacterium JH1-16]|nr:hypothetical protein [Neisseriaceae bacterium JH1-16]
MQTLYDRLLHRRYQLLFGSLLLALLQSPLTRALGMDHIEVRIAGAFLVLVMAVVIIGELRVRRGRGLLVGGGLAVLLWLGVWLSGHHRVVEIGYLLWGRWPSGRWR